MNSFAVGLGYALTVLAFFGTAVFVTTYHLLAPWWRSEIGRNIMAGFACEAVILGLAVLAMAFGDYPGRQVLGLLAFAAFTGVSWWRWVVLIRAQIPPPHGEENH